MALAVGLLEVGVQVHVGVVIADRLVELLVEIEHKLALIVALVRGIDAQQR